MDKEQLISTLEHAAAEMDFSSVETLAGEALKAYPEETFGYEYLSDALMQRASVPYSAVEMCLIKLIQLDAHNTDVILKYAALKQAQGEVEEALNAFRNVVAQDHSNVTALNALGEYELYVNDFPEQALVYFDAAIPNDPLNPTLRCNRAAALKQAGRILDAMMELNAVMQNGFNEKAYTLKVELMNEMQRFADTIPLLEDLASHVPDNFTYQYYLGRNLTLLGKWEKAVPALEKAVSLIALPDAELLALYAETLMNVGRYDAAQEAILKSITTAPDVFSYQVLQLRIKAAQQKYEEALAMADALLSQADDTFKNTIRSEKGFILVDMGRSNEAATLFNEMLQSAGNRAYGSFGLAYLAFHIEKDLAKTFFYINNARILGHPNASNFIDKHLTEYLKKTQEKLLAENSPNISENRNNTLLQPLFGKLWHFEDINSAQLEGASEEIIKKVKSQLKKRILFFTENGVLMSSASDAKTFTYKIKAQHDKGIIDLELIPLNGLNPLMVRLHPVAKGLVFLQDEGEYLLFQSHDLENLTTELKTHLREIIDKAALSFMGEAAAPLLEGL